MDIPKKPIYRASKSDSLTRISDQKDRGKQRKMIGKSSELWKEQQSIAVIHNTKTHLPQQS
jgi:hypothetical protein